MNENACAICGNNQLNLFFELFNVPVHCNVLWTSQEAARHCPKGDIKLTFCPVCSYITNNAFEQARLEYTKAYENPLHFSPLFKEYSKLLAARLLRDYNLIDKDIIEIGCGDGYFLTLLCQLGKNRGVGFDPAYIKQKNHDKLQKRVKFIPDYYSERYMNHQADLIVCRQTLEHIPNPKDFLTMIRRAIGIRLNTHVFFEVPNAVNIFRNLFIWDIIYEHCSYFTPASLLRTFLYSGFQVCELTEEYNDQYLCLRAKPNNQNSLSYDHPLSSEVRQVERDIASFATRYQNKVEIYQHKLEEIKDNGQRVVVWGTGSKGVTFLNTFKNHHQIEFAVDLNPHKHGMYIPGAGQQIVPPEFLKDYRPDLIILMNPIYLTEIEQITENLGLTVNFMSV